MNKGRHVPKKYRHVFSPEADEVIRVEYRRLLAGRRPYAVKERLGTKLGVPGWVTQRRATELGLSRIKEPRWSDPELELLAKHAHKNPDRIREVFAKHGFKRSRNAIGLMIKRRLGGVRMNRPWYTANELATLLGIDRHAPLRWISSGQLRAERVEDFRTDEQGGYRWAIRRPGLRDFIRDHPEAIDLRKVDQLWFLDLLTNTDANACEGNGRISSAPNVRKSRSILLEALRSAWQSLPESWWRENAPEAHAQITAAIQKAEGTT